MSDQSRAARFLMPLAGLAGLGLLAACIDRTQLWEDHALYAGWRVQSHVLSPLCRLRDEDGRVRAAGTGADCAAALDQARREQGVRPASGHLVILLHGLGRSPRMFDRMERSLRDAGYEAVAISYPSLTKGVAAHADNLERLLDGLEDVDRVSFVTHSLGGLVLRETLAREGAWRARIALGRAVLLAPPSQGSELARALEDFAPFRVVGGPSAGELAEDVRFPVPPPGFAFAIIAGGRADGRGYNPLLSTDNDGLVTVPEARLPGAREFLVVPVVHTFIASAPETIVATRAFLDSGRFP